MSFYSRTCATRRKVFGVTLLEILVTLTLIAITAAWVWPRFSFFSQQAEVIRFQHQWESLMADARLQALETGREVTVCPSADGVHCDVDWSAGWLVHSDEGVRLLRLQPAFTEAQLHARLVPVKPVRVFFDDAGQSSTGTFWLCLRGGRAPALAWSLSRFGRLRRLTESEARAFPCEAG